jgi:hypothetical protein
METFIDRGQLRKLAEPTVLSNGKRIPGRKLDHPRQLAVMHSLVRFANVAAGGKFTTADVYVPALDALGMTADQYSLASFRYDLSKLRAKGLVERIPKSRRYRLVGKGYSICVAFLKLFEKIYAPLTAGLLAHSAETAPWPRRSAANSTAFTSTSATIWTHSYAPLVYESPRDLFQREQNSRSVRPFQRILE